MVEQDYVMRMIHEYVRMLLKLLFGIDEKQEIIEFQNDKSDNLYKKLLQMIDDGRINEAENLLCQKLGGSDDIKDFRIWLLFYDHINMKDDEFLKKADYTRDEIREGILAASRQYGYENLIETCLNI